MTPPNKKNNNKNNNNNNNKNFKKSQYPDIDRNVIQNDAACSQLL